MQCLVISYHERLKYTIDDIIEAIKNDEQWEVPEEEQFLVDFIDTFLLLLQEVEIMSMQALYESRKDNLLKAVNRQGPSAIPILANTAQGVVAYADTTYTEAIQSLDQFVPAMTKIFDDLYTDLDGTIKENSNQAGTA